MAIRNVLHEGAPELRQIAREVTEFDHRLVEFASDLFDTMRYENGCGLAAPQVGISKRICVISTDEGQTEYVLVNPVITKSVGVQTSVEGCLSVPNFRAKLKRPKRITVKYQDINGASHEVMAEGFLATVFCHEIDHLNGVLFVDKIIKK